MNKDSKIYVAGHSGLVGSAIMRQLLTEGYENIITRTHSQLDLTRQADVEHFFQEEKPEYVILAAAKVGGIMANISSPVEFLSENLQIACNVINSCYINGVKRLVYLGSSCIYPNECPQPIKEEFLLSSQLEPANEGYALAKICGLRLCEYYNSQYGAKYVSLMPCNLYGDNDNFDLKTAHVLSALIRKFHEAKMNCRGEVTVWGAGNAMRELMHVNDLARACTFLLKNNFSESFLNVGTGTDISIKNLAETVKNIVNCKSTIIYDSSKPEGMKRRVLDVSKINALGWKATISLEDGIRSTYEWYLKNIATQG